MSINKHPDAFFDTLEEMANPFKNPALSVDHLLAKPIEGALADFRLASEFLYSYRGSPDTFSTYRRELEHFLQWAWLISKKNLQSIQREDIEAYVEFSRKPPVQWIGAKNVARFINFEGERRANPDWRPYIGKTRAGTDNDEMLRYILSQSALQSLFSVLSSFFNFLAQEDYVSANPVAQIRQKSKFMRKQQAQSKIRRLSPLQWDVVIETAAMMAADNPLVHERTLFIMAALYGMYLRISELVVTDRWAPEMGHFQRDIEGNWWFTTVGKGNKEREISVSDAMLNALRRYRLSRGLTPLPAPGEPMPLIHKTRGTGGISSTRQIRSIVQLCFDTAEQRLRAEELSEEADRLAAATVHWLRHTGISEDVKHRPREHVRDDAGHGSSAITDRYIDVERTERHASARSKLIKT